MTPRERSMSIVAEVAREHGVKVADVLQTGCRARPIVRARHAAIRAIAEQRPDYYTTQIARIFRCDHTSVLYALGRLTRKPKVSA